MTDFRVSTTHRISPNRIVTLREAAGLHAVSPEDYRDVLGWSGTLAVVSAWQKGHGGQMIGFGLLLDNGAAAEINDFFVAQSSRKQGVGTAMASQLLSAAQELGIARVEAQVSSAAEINLASKLGFKLEGIAVNDTYIAAFPNLTPSAITPSI